MINHLEGRIIESSPTHAVVDCNGIGYFVNITVSTYSKISGKEKVRLLTHLIVNQQDYSQNMYGFLDEIERSVFRHLLSVSGVGASTARMVLSSLSPGEVQQAITSGNFSIFKSIKGIGEKTAQRIIVDLSGKLDKDQVQMVNRGGTQNKVREEALMALLTLGFAKNSSEKAIDKVLSAKVDSSVEQIVKESLKNL